MSGETAGQDSRQGGVLARAGGMVVLRNDTGRDLGPDDLHLMTVVGQIPDGQAAQTLLDWMTQPVRFYTADEIRAASERAGARLRAELLGLDVNAGRKVPASPTDPVSVGLDAAGGHVVAVQQDGVVTVISDTDALS